MDAIDELIDAAQTFYEDARRDENGRSRSWEHCYRVFRDARTDPSPDYDYLSLHLAFYLASWGMYRGSSAVSMGGSNEFVECFCWGAVVEGGSGAVVELVGDGVEVWLVAGDGGSFG